MHTMSKANDIDVRGGIVGRVRYGHVWQTLWSLADCFDSSGSLVRAIASQSWRNDGWSRLNTSRSWLKAPTALCEEMLQRFSASCKNIRNWCHRWWMCFWFWFYFPVTNLYSAVQIVEVTFLIAPGLGIGGMQVWCAIYGFGWFCTYENAKQLHDARLRLALYFQFPHVVGSTATATRFFCNRLFLK